MKRFDNSSLWNLSHFAFYLQLDKNDYICKMDGKIRIYIRLYRFFEFFILYQLIFYLTITIQFLSMIK